MKATFTALVMALGLITIAAPLHAQDTKKVSKAQDLTDRLRQADPPKVTTSTTTAAQICKVQNAVQKKVDIQTSKRFTPDKIIVPPAVTKSTSTATANTDKKKP